MPDWTRKLTFPEDATDDFTVLRNGLVVGRAFRDRNQTGRADVWRWSILTLPARSGWCGSLDEALEQVRGLATDRWPGEPRGWP